MDRKKRLETIAALLEEQGVSGQQELKDRLAKKGVRVSQASLSRDLKALGAQRVRHPQKGWVYALPPAPPAASSQEAFRRRLRASVQEVKRAQFILLLATPPGEANLVGRLLDEAALPGLLGTVAGDDTIIAVTAGESSAKKLERLLKEIML